MDESPTERLTWQDALDEGRAGEALARYRRSEQVDGDIYDALDALAAMQVALRDKGYARAVRALGDVERRPDFVDWDGLEADLLQLKKGAEEVARSRVEDALLTLTPIDTPLLRAEVETLRGTVQVFDNRVDLAKTHFERALAVDPKNYRAMTNLGNLALEAGDVDAAIAAYERALALNDTFGNAHHNLGVAYRRKGQVGKSVRALRKAQGASQKQIREEARESLRSGVGGGLAKYGRWLVYFVVAAALFLLLRSRGLV